MASLESVEEKIEQKVRLMIASFEALKVQNCELRQTISGLEEELKNTKEALISALDNKFIEFIKCMKSINVLNIRHIHTHAVTHIVESFAVIRKHCVDFCNKIKH